MTPRQIAAWLHFADRRTAMAEASEIHSRRLSQYGDVKAVKAYMKTLLGK